MAETCKMAPTVKVKEGNRTVEKPSILFADIKRALKEYKPSWDLWASTKTKEFKENYGSLVSYDKQGEVTFPSLVDALGWREVYDDTKSLQSTIKEWGFDEKVFKKGSEAVQAINDFNAREKKYVATVQKQGDEYRINVVHRNGDSLHTAATQAYNSALTEEIIKFLKELGFGVSFVEDARYNGLFDPTNAKLRDNLLQVISIAKGNRGEEALPEEFAHVIIEGLQDHPLVQRLLTSIDDATIRETLGEQYEEYSNEYNHDIARLKKEVAGKMLAEHITKKGTIAPRIVKEKQSLLSRIWNWAKGIFKKVDKSQVDKLYTNADNAVGQIYDLVASRKAIKLIDKTRIISAEKLYSLRQGLDTMRKVASESVSKQAKIYNYYKRRDDKDTKETRAFTGSILQTMQQMYKGDQFYEGTIEFLQSLVDPKGILSELYNRTQTLAAFEEDTRIDDIKIINSAARTVRDVLILNEALKEYLTFVSTLDMLDDDTLESLGMSSDNAKELSNYGRQINIMCAKLTEWAGRVKINVITKAFQTVFKNNISIDIGDRKGEIMALEEIIKHSLKDINVVDRWFSALSDADDAFLVLFDKLLKVQQFARDQEIIELQKQIAYEDKLLRDAGFSTEFMYEIGPDGIPTKYIKSIYDWDGYKEAYRKKAEELREVQKQTGLTDAQYYERLKKWETNPDEKTGLPKKIKVYVDPKIDALYKERGRKYVEQHYPDAMFEMMPNPEVFTKNKDFLKNLENQSPAQFRYYSKMIEMKRRMMLKIPHRGQHIYQTIYISKDFIEGVIDNSSGNPVSATAEWCKKQFLRRSDDIGFGMTDDFEEQLNGAIHSSSDPATIYDNVIKLIQDNIDDDSTVIIDPEYIRRIINKVQRGINSGSMTEVEGKKAMLDKISDVLATSDVYVRNTDFANHEIQQLPIYYSRPLENMKMLSMDFTGAITAYMGMAVNYEKMNAIVDIAELSRDYTKERAILVNDNGKPKQSKIAAFGEIYKAFVTRAGIDSSIRGRIDDYMTSVMYEKRKLDEGSFEAFGTRFDKAKTLDAIKDYSGLLGLGFNIFSTFSNVSMGKLQQWIEAFAHEHFGYKSYAKAVEQYAVMMPEYFAEMAEPLKKSKLGLLIEMFDPLGDYYENLRNPNYSKNIISRVLGNNQLAYIGMNAGEHMLHCQTMLAILEEIKLDRKDGTKVSLLDALRVEEVDGIHKLVLEDGLSYERVKIDTSGRVTFKGDGTVQNSTNPNYGKPLKGEDGKYITEKIELKDNALSEFLFKKKSVIRKVNDSLNGAFSVNDKGAIHKYALGRMVIQFRQWMPAHYMRRFASAHYDADMEQWREGYYRTFHKAWMQMFKDIRKGKFTTMAIWGSLSDSEKANMRRAYAEIGEFLMLLGLIHLGGKVDDKERGWFDKMVLYQLRRMYVEVGASLPYNPFFFNNIFQIMNAPAAAFSAWDKFKSALASITSFEEVQSGRFEGWNEFERGVFKLTPFDQLHKAYYFENSMFTQFESDNGKYINK